LSGVLKVSSAELHHIPLTTGLQLSLQIVRMVADAHDRGEIVGILDAAHLVCASSGALSFKQAGGDPIAPELSRGELPDRLTDVYAVGALMYRLLSGQRVNPRRVNEPPSHFNPAVDSSLDELVLECLEEDPSERPYSAAEVERRLLDVYDELGLEPDSKTEATHLISSTVAKRKPKAKAAPQRIVVMEDEDDDWEPQLPKSADKKWLLVGLASLAALAFMVLTWPPKKHEAPAPAADVAEVAAKPEPAPAPTPKVEARLVPAEPAAPEKAAAKPSVKTTVRKAPAGKATHRRGRR
jgi:serine/threonine-protein kinase